MSGLPKGWIELDTKDTFDLIPTTGKNVKTKETNTYGKFPVIDQGQDYICGYIDNADKLIEVVKPVTIFGDHTRIFKWVDFSFVPGADGTKVLSSKGFLLEKFFYYQLRQLELPDKGYARHFKFLKASLFKLAPLNEQIRIANKLDSLLAKVEATQKHLDKISTLLKRFRQSVLAAAVSGELVKFTNTSETCLKELGNLVGGKTPSKSNSMFWDNGTIPWVSPKDMKVDIICKSQDKITELALEKGMKLVESNSILMVTRSGILAHTFPVALTACDVTINQDIKAFTADINKVYPKYIWIVLKGYEYKILSECSKTGTTVSSIETHLLENFMFRLPSIKEQKQIVKRVEALFALADKVEQQYHAAKQRTDRLTQSILAKAFRGELVPQDPNDEPASELLKRIQESK